MKAMIVALSLAVLGAGLAPTEADARRLGSGSSTGMQRSLPARPPTATPPSQATQPAAPTTAGAPAAAAAAQAAAPKRSWLGPLAGLAAGLGIAALMSHLGLGAGFGEFLMLALIAIAAVFAIRFLMRRFSPRASAPRMATPNGMTFDSAPAATAAAPALSAPATTQAASALPAGFDAAAFERIAKMIFIRMQAANDSGDLNDLRAFTTPEMYAPIKLELQERGSKVQRTDVVRVDAEVLDVANETERQVVSVRFHGLIREEMDGVATPFDEVWHLVKPADGSREWAIAGIQQSAVA